MPYKSEKIKLTPKYDRRWKLTIEQHNEIRDKYKTGNYSQRQLAKEYNCSRRNIVFIIYPERKPKTIYKGYNEKHRDDIKEHRRYKQDLYKKGLIKE